MTDTMKAPKKWVKVSQGPTTAVYQLMGRESVLETIITHHWPKPVLFRKSRRLS